MNRSLFPLLILVLFASGISTSQELAWRKRLNTLALTVGVNPLNPNSVYGEMMGLVVSYNQGLDWQTLGHPPSSELRQILIHPADTSVIFCLAFGGGLNRSSDYGATWTMPLPDVGIDGESLCLDPQHPDTMYFGDFVGGAVYRSMDRGVTWEFRSNAGSFLCALAVRPDSSNILYAGTGGGTISKSTDGGLSWRIVKSTGSAEIPKIVVDPSDPLIAFGTGYAGNVDGQGVWKTIDGGEEWSLTSLTETSVWGMDIDVLNPNSVYAGLFGVFPQPGSGAGVFKTEDGGLTWNILSNGLPDEDNNWSIKVHPLDSDVVWYAGVSGIYRLVPPLATISGVIIDATTMDTVMNGFVQLGTTGERVLLDETNGSFSLHYFEGDTSLTADIHIESFPYYLRDEPIEFIVDSVLSHDIVLTPLPRTVLTGTVRDSTSDAPLVAEVTLTAITSLGLLDYLVTTNPTGGFEIDSLFVSQPPIVSYEALNVDPVFPHAGFGVSPIVLDTIPYVLDLLADTADVLIASSEGSGDYLHFYAEVFDSLDLSYHVWDRSVNGIPPFPSVVMLRKGIAVYYTGIDSMPIPQAELDSLSEGILAGTRMFFTGQNFVESNASSFLVGQLLGLAHGGTIHQVLCRGTSGDIFDGLSFLTIAGNGAGNQTSRDILQIVGSTAISIVGYGSSGNEGISAVRCDSLGDVANAVVFGFGFEAVNIIPSRQTLMQSIIGYLDGSNIVGVATDELEGPLAFRLDQNYPNPFNPSTTIRFSIPTSGVVSLKIFNLLGEEVATLVSENRDAGTHAIRWDATGQPSGVYFYRLQAGEFVETRKLVLLR